MPTRDPPLSYQEVSNRLQLTGAHYLGIREIPVGRIVGSVARNAGFDRRFRPLRPDASARLRSLADAFPNADFPPITVYEVGGSYFVVDGHHRVALSRERGIACIPAEVTRIDTPYELPPDADVCQLVHTEQQHLLMEDSGLARARPEAVLEFSRVEGYPELLELVKAHGYDLMRARGRLLDPAEIAADWYDTVYRPGLAALRREQLPADYGYKTDADLFLWIYRQRRALAAVDHGVDFRAAARRARTRRVGRRFRRAALRQKRTPLRRRGHPRGDT